MNHPRLLVSFVLAVTAAWPAANRRIVAADFAVQQEADRVLITDDGQPVATYVFRDDKILRPYFANVHAPGGIQVTRNHPPVPKVDATDYDTMHPGVWLAFGDQEEMGLGVRVATPIAVKQGGTILDAASGDFRLKPGSPALALGFKPSTSR